MSKKLRLGDLPLDHDEIDNELFTPESETRERLRPTKNKRKKQEFDNYANERAMKRSNTERYI